MRAIYFMFLPLLLAILGGIIIIGYDLFLLKVQYTKLIEKGACNFTYVFSNDLLWNIEIYRNMLKDKYWTDEGFDVVQSPYEILKKGGDCDDYALLLYCVARRLGYEPHIYASFIWDKESKKIVGHAFIKVNGVRYDLGGVMNDTVLMEIRLY